MLFYRMYNFNLYKIHVHARNFTIISTNFKSHYESLGVPVNATQADIKTAYYKLSMLYHPDKNKGSEKAAENFRAITSAYEILGNYKLRKLYDKGVIQDDDAEKYSSNDVHPHTNFYKSRTSSDKYRPHMPTGRTPIYDFDEWSKIHYGNSFARRNSAKARYEEKVRVDKKNLQTGKKENVVFAVGLVFVTFLLLSYTYNDELDEKLISERNK